VSIEAPGADQTHTGETNFSNQNLAENTPNPLGIAQDLKVLGSLFAPISILSALLLYVGWVHTRAFFAYFGINVEILEFGPQQYILRSGYVGLGAVSLLAVILGLALIIDRLIQWIIDRSSRSRRTIATALATLGFSLAISGMFQVTASNSVSVVATWASAASIAGGAILFLRYGSQIWDQEGMLGPGTNAFGLLIIGFTLFWVATSYAEERGLAAAASIDQDPTSLPVITIYSESPLDLTGANITPSSPVLIAPEKWSYRYTGGQLLTYGKGRWFLITSPATQEYHSTISIVQDNGRIRVDTTVPRSRH
jgi:hypothetical protein